MADNKQTVGTGKAYATLALWDASEGGTDPGVGFFNIAECTGDCGTGAAINGAHVRGYKILGTTDYDGSNDSALAFCARISLDADNGLMQHFKVTNNNGFDNALGIFGANTFAEDVYIDDSSTSSTSYGAVNLRGAGTNKGMRRFVIKATCAVLIRTGFNSPMILANGVGSGGTVQGISAAGSNQELTDLFFFDCNSSAFSGAFDVASNLASDDATATHTPYTSSELVLYPTNNQTKSTSDLATLGSPFIGAFLESSGGISGTITQTIQSFTQSLSGNVVNAYTGTITQNAQSFTQSAAGSTTAQPITGAINQTIAAFTQSALGDVVSSGISGTINQALSSFTQSASGSAVLNISGVITQTVSSFTQSLSGTVAEQITGVISQTATSFTMSAAGKVPASWADKLPANTTWSNQTPITTIWTDR